MIKGIGGVPRLTPVGPSDLDIGCHLSIHSLLKAFKSAVPKRRQAMPESSACFSHTPDIYDAPNINLTPEGEQQEYCYQVCLSVCVYNCKTTHWISAISFYTRIESPEFVLE